jgi:hypothetical protein
MTRALLIIIATLLLFGSCKGGKDNNPADASFGVSTFKSDAGWGYAVAINGKTYIRQPYIPAVSGKTPFKNEQDARTVGKYVCTLIKARQLPAVRTADLIKLGILTDSGIPVRP